MFDGFSFSGVVPQALQSLDDPYIPVYQVAAPPQLWNFFGGATTDELVTARPGEFVGATLANGSHADSLLGGNPPIIDLFAQLVTKILPPARQHRGRLHVGHRLDQRPVPGPGPDRRQRHLRSPP